MNAHRVGMIAVLLASACKPAESPCEKLAKQFCADGSLDCGMVSSMFTAAKLPDAACVEGLEGMGTMEMVSADMRSYVKQAVLLELLKRSPVLSAEQVEGLAQGARGTAEANAGAIDPVAPMFSGYEVRGEEAAPTPAPAAAGPAPAKAP